MHKLKKAAFFGAHRSFDLDDVKHFDGKVFATPQALEQIENAGLSAQLLADPLGVVRLHDFGYREIHLFGFDYSGDGQEICFNNQVFKTNADDADTANRVLNACMDVIGNGSQVAIHGGGMLAAMAEQIMAKSQERILTAVYDMQVCPPTYEFFSFITQAEKHRATNGYTAMDVVFFPGPMLGFRYDGLPPSPRERDSMLHRICVSGARLVRSVRNVHVMRERSHLQGDIFPRDWTNDLPRYLYGPRYQINGYQCLKASDAARDEIAVRFPEPYATITLREAEYWPKRNSNRLAWEKAARWLFDAAGIRAICVPDTHGDALRDCDSFEAAAWDIDLRMALYERATINLGIANGPMVLPMFSAESCPYLMFQKPDETSPGTNTEFMNAQGMKHGDQYTRNGLTVWEDDTPDNVIRVLETWHKTKCKAAA